MPQQPTAPTLVPAGLYGSTASLVVFGELYRLDPATGGVLQDIGPLNDSSGTNYGMTGLAFDPTTGVLYGSTSGGAPIQGLVRIDPLTAGVTVIGNYGFTGAAQGHTISDLTFAGNGTLYGVLSGGGCLYTINKSTGAPSPVGPGCPGSASISISSAGIAYGGIHGGGISSLGTYSLSTGSYSDLMTLVIPSSGVLAALTFSPSNVLYGAALSGPAHLVTIDTSTGTVTYIGPTVDGLDGLAFTTAGPTAADVTISGRVLDRTGAGLRNARVVITDSRGHKFTAVTNAFGYYTFQSVPSGDSYVVTARSRGLTFSPHVVAVNDSVAGLDLSPQL